MRSELRRRRRRAIIDDAARAGATLRHVWVVEGGPANDADLFFFTTRRFRHLYLQPYDGTYALPGEHHGLLRGAWPAPALLRTAGLFATPTWHVPGDLELDRRLERDPEIARVTSRLAWRWAPGIDLLWTVQVRCVGDSTVGTLTQLVARIGRDQATRSPGVGVAVFIDLVNAIGPALDRDAFFPEQRPLQPFLLPIGPELLKAPTPEVRADRPPRPRA